MAKTNITHEIPMNGEYKMEVIDRKTKQEYTILFYVVPDAIRGCPVHINRCSAKPYRKKEPKPSLDLHERKPRLSFGIEKLF